MSGHSKWSTIKHKKAAKDAKRGKIFTRIGKEISISARDGGGDPEMNPRLRLAIANAKANNMPNDNITRAIKKGTGELEGAQYEEITYEGYGPNGGSVILETVTDNKNRTVAEIRSQFSKLGGNMGDNGSVQWNFDRKGVVEIRTNDKKEDELLELVLDAGAEDMEFDQEISRIICAYDDLSICTKYLEEHGMDVAESKLEFLPKTTVDITDLEAAKKVMRFLEALEENDDVQNLYSNYEIDESLVEQIT